MLELFSTFRDLIATRLTLGREDQSFIGAAWVCQLLRAAPSRLRRKLALNFLAISPHYFYRIASPEYATMSRSQWLEAESERNRVTRMRLCKELIEPWLQSGDTVLDIGCGGGYLAKAVSLKAKKVFACDISNGVLECARILNSGPNLEFLHSSPAGWGGIPNGSVDLVYSVAVIQHVRAAVIEALFEMMAQKLKPGGQALLQVQLEGAEWREEEQWVRDRSLKGRLRWKYALNFFPRSEAYFRNVCGSVGLEIVSLRPMKEILSGAFDDVFGQHLLSVRRLT
jgi:SAM-dependent methyltransferase